MSIKTSLANQVTACSMALGAATLAHAAGWHSGRVVAANAGIWNYVESYQALLPTVQLPHSFAGCTFCLIVIVAVCQIANAWQVKWTLAQLPLLLVHYLLQGPKPSNHFFVLLMGHLAYTGSWLASPKGRRSATADTTDMLDVLRANALVVAMSTYLFAGVAKLNSSFFDLNTSIAAGFVRRPIAPLDWAVRRIANDDSQLWIRRAYTVAGVCVALAVEFGVATALLFARCRRVAVTVGLGFHFLLAGFSAWEFSMVMLALYVPILSPKEYAEALSNYVLQPGPGRVFFATLATSYLVWVHERGALADGTLFATPLALGLIIRLMCTFLLGYVFLSMCACQWQSVKRAVVV